MRFSDIEIEAASHRAAVVTLLRSHLPYRRKGPAARALCVSREYLWRVLRPQPLPQSDDESARRFEPLGLDRAVQLADWLHLDATSREQLLEHAALSRESRVKACTAFESALVHRELDVVLPELLNLHTAANRESNPTIASDLYTRSYCKAKQLIKSLPPRDYPLEFAQVCLVLNDLEAVLNRNADGIYHARLAGHWAKEAGTKESTLLGKDADDLWGNALVAEAVSERNLGLDKQAMNFLSSEDFTKLNNVWSCEAALHRLKCAAFAERTALWQVDKLSDQYLEAVAKFGSRTDQATTHLAVSEAKLRSYIACGPGKLSLKKADSELEQCLLKTAPNESEESRVFAFLSQTSALRAVIFLNTYSRLLRERKEFLRAENMRAQAESRASQAGLTHQLARIRAGSLYGY
jgi:hypothetical protein